LSVNLRSDRTSSLTRAVVSHVRFADGRSLRCSSSIRVLPSENILYQRMRCCIISKCLPKFSMCCGGNVTEFNTHTHKDGISLRNVLCFRFQDEVHKHVLTCRASTPHWGIAKPCHCIWGWRKDQGQRLSVLAGCSNASTVRRKSYSFVVGPRKSVRVISVTCKCITDIFCPRSSMPWLRRLDIHLIQSLWDSWWSKW
jgi:hypothetical protein